MATPFVAVTGASGHVGANLVRALLAQGRRVRVLVHKSTRGIDGLPVEAFAADVLDPKSLRSALAEVGTVFHLAAKISAGWEPAAVIDQVNVQGTRNVVAACQEAGVRRLVHFSSIEAFALGAGPIEETCPLASPGARDGTGYGITKAEGERAVRAALAAGLDAVILYPTAIIGPLDFQLSPMGEVLRALARGRLPALVAGASFDFVDVRDVVAGALAAEQRGGRGEGYLLSGTRLSLVELARRWAEVTGRPAPRWAAPMWMARLGAPFAPAIARLRGRRPLFTTESLRVLRTSRPVDRGKAERVLDYRPRPLAETLRDTWAFVRPELES
jgi:dihydroflavonol-4-reductase